MPRWYPATPQEARDRARRRLGPPRPVPVEGSRLEAERTSPATDQTAPSMVAEQSVVRSDGLQVTQPTVVTVSHRSSALGARTLADQTAPRAGETVSRPCDRSARTARASARRRYRAHAPGWAGHARTVAHRQCVESGRAVPGVPTPGARSSLMPLRR